MQKIQRIKMVLVSALLPGIIVLLASTAIANESQDVIEKSISNSSGPQLNLNIHNKDPLPLSNEKVFPDRTSIFRDEYSESTMQYIANKKLTITDPTIFEPYIGSFNDASHDSSLKPILPCVDEEFYMVGKVQAKSNRDQNPGHNCSSILCPNLVIEAYTDTHPEHTHFPNYKGHPDDPLTTLGLSGIRNLYNASPEEFVRLEGTTSEEEEKPSAMSPIFKWLGWVCRMIFVGTDEDGDIDAYGLTFVKTD
jgi:hypothetical protein